MQGNLHDAITRFDSHWTRDDNGCHVWMLGTDRDEYGQFKVDGETRQAHVWRWEQEHGPIPEGYELDHRCRNTSCVNLDHLQCVTKEINRRRQAQALASKRALQKQAEIEDTKELEIELHERGPHIRDVAVPVESLPATARWFADLTGEYVGRPTKLTKEIHEMILRLVIEGNYPSVAARACGIDSRTWSRWNTDYKSKGEKSKFAQLMMDVEQAEAMAQSEIVSRLNFQTRAAGRDVNSSATLALLERRFNTKEERWIPRNATELTGADGGPIETNSNIGERFKEKLAQVEKSMRALNPKKEKKT